MMSMLEAKKLLDEQKAILVDIREQKELEEEGMASGAVWLPLSRLNNESELMAKISRWDRQKIVLLYCKSGGRAGRLKNVLIEKGVSCENVGGLKDWIEAGFPTQAFDPNCSVNDR